MIRSSVRNQQAKTDSIDAHIKMKQYRKETDCLSMVPFIMTKDFRFILPIIKTVRQ